MKYLIKLASYGDVKGTQYSPASVLLSKYRHTGVCDGYSRAFKMICDYCGIPCLFVLSTYDDHSWNMVQLENGKWYGVDATWGDSGVKADYRWFMFGKNEVSSGEHPGKAEASLGFLHYQFSLPKLASSSLRYKGAA